MNKIGTNRPDLDVDELENFVLERQFEDIPEVFPDDFGDVPPFPTAIDMIKRILELEI